jgi:hypothetical protein
LICKLFVTLAVTYYETAAGRSQAIDFLAALPVKQRAEIVADIEAFRLGGWDAPISCRWIRGHHPMMEILTGGFGRTASLGTGSCGFFTLGGSRRRSATSRQHLHG